MPRGFKSGGRQKGSKNKVAADVKELAQEHGPEAIRRLLKLMRSSDNDQTQVAAAKELLDRGYGKALARVESETTVHYVARVPEKATSVEAWQQQQPSEDVTIQ